MVEYKSHPSNSSGSYPIKKLRSNIGQMQYRHVVQILVDFPEHMVVCVPSTLQCSVKIMMLVTLQKCMSLTEGCTIVVDELPFAVGLGLPTIEYFM